MKMLPSSRAKRMMGHQRQSFSVDPIDRTPMIILEERPVVKSLSPYFPEEGNEAESVIDRRNKRWEMVGGFIGIPKFTLFCSACDSNDIQVGEVKWMRHYLKDEVEITVGYRQDIRMKCRVCSKLHWFGLPLTEEEWKLVPGSDKKNVIYARWRTVHAMIEDIKNEFD